MGIRFRAGSRVTKTIKTTKNFPLTIKHVRAMFQVADLRERVILSTTTDLGLRIDDFLALKKTDLPPLDQEPPIPFVTMTDKEDVVAHSFLSQETVDLSKIYLPTLEKKHGNPCLFPSNGDSHISDEWMNRLLQRLAEKAKIDLNGKDLTFHCFRKMFLSASVDSGIGMTAGKMVCGKAIAQSEDTYLTIVKLREKFILLKKFLAINGKPKIETQKLEVLESAVCKLQEELTQQKQITESISKENVKTKEELRKLQPLVEFINSFDAPKNLKMILNFLRNHLLDEYADENLRPLKVEFSPYISKQLEEIAKTNGITEKEALRQLLKDDLKMWENGEKRFRKLEEGIKKERQKGHK
jgi:hypothetical protein